MKRFYIKEIGATGSGKPVDIVEFRDGVNIVHGPSNTGKSYIVSCINYMFGADTVPFSTESTGYDTIIMVMENQDGDSVRMQRAIEKGGVKSNTVVVTSNLLEIENKEYSTTKYEYSELLLRLIGIEDTHKIISSKEFATKLLTIRTIFHFFFIDEDNIISKSSTLDTPGYSAITANLSALLFMITGNDYSEMIPVISKKERELNKAKKTAVVNYINGKIQNLSVRRAELEKAISEFGNVDAEQEIEDIVEEISSVEQQIVEGTQKSRAILEEIYAVSSKLEEARFLRDRYGSLRSQYTADIKRLEFITDGDAHKNGKARVSKCPFCDRSMPKDSPVLLTYTQSAQAELNKVNLQMQDLNAAENDVSSEIDILERRLRQLTAQNNNITRLVNQQLKPKASALKVSLDSYKRLLWMKRELELVDSFSVDMNTDASNTEGVDEESALVYEPKAKFDHVLWKKWSDSFESAVKACNYPAVTSARISMETLDAIIGGKKKQDEGKGFRAFINTLMVFTLMKFLEDSAQYAPHLLILDSPVLSLKEKKLSLKAGEAATASMKSSLFSYIISNCGNNQVIIIENDLPPNVNYEKAYMVEFTMDNENGRYGFLSSLPETSRA